MSSACTGPWTAISASSAPDEGLYDGEFDIETCDAQKV